MSAYLLGVQYQLPAVVRTNEELAAINPGWDAMAIFRKTGIRQRYVTRADETAADLACAAAEKLLGELAFDREAIDALLFCTESPDVALPTTACMLQERLHLLTTCGALDFNLGCSGFTYGLWLARSMILSGCAANVLLLVGDTYSKYCNIHDITTVTIFGDGAAAALISASPQGAMGEVGHTVVGTDGRGFDHLIVRAGGARRPRGEPMPSPEGLPDRAMQEQAYLYMNGPEVFSFTLRAVRAAIQQLLDRTALTWESVDLFLMHQANRYMLEALRNAMKIPSHKMPIDMEDCGNTVSASIPILIRRCLEHSVLKAGQKCVLAGFGAGYSWAMTQLSWGVSTA